MKDGIFPELIVITGPTATGKSTLGVQLAGAVDGEIVSADSMQVYMHMKIGTAAPTTEEMCGIPHHLINFVPPREDYSVARYVSDASKCIDDILRRGKRPVLVGGSGMYIDSLIAGRCFQVRGNTGLRRKLEKEYDDIGSNAMLKKLRDVDAESAEKLCANDKKRIVRALEVFETTGKPISEHDKESKMIPLKYDALKIALTFSDRADLYSGIDRRVDDMISRGLINEVDSLLKMGVSRNSTSMQAIGYKEFSSVLTDDRDIINESVITGIGDKIKMESRRYAKRQLTWLRRDKNVKWIIWNGTPDYNSAVLNITELLNEKK